MRFFERKNKTKSEKEKRKYGNTSAKLNLKKKEEVTQKNTEVQVIETTTKTKTITQEYEPIDNQEKTDENDTSNLPFYSKYIYKRLVIKKLTILLLENTLEVNAEKENLMKIVKMFSESGLLVIINYGKCVNVSETFDVSTSNGDINFSYIEAKGNETCLYDALVELKNVISDKYMKVEETEKEKIKVGNIEIIGVGTCKDNCSKVSKEIGINCFYNVINKPDVVTKYYCLTDETFINAAEVGFRAIGAISRNYQ